MTAATLALALALTGLPAPPAEAAHAANPLYRSLLDEGWTADGTRVTFPVPTLNDGMSAEVEAAALKTLARTASELAELTRDSVSAPFVLRNRDVKTPGGVVRQADLWFVVQAGLEAIDPDRAAGGLGDAKPVEAANMRFTARRLGTDDLARVAPGDGGSKPGDREWYVHMTGRLLDRLYVEATDRIAATRGEGSWVIASRTDTRFDRDEGAPNRWWPFTLRGNSEVKGTVSPYAGGASYAKISRLATVPGALLVEAHFAFHEPRSWFDGAPILRSKIGLVAQDRIRGLRRELAKSQKGQGARSTGAGVTPARGGS